MQQSIKLRDGVSAMNILATNYFLSLKAVQVCFPLARSLYYIDKKGQKIDVSINKLNEFELIAGITEYNIYPAQGKKPLPSFFSLLYSWFNIY